MEDTTRLDDQDARRWCAALHLSLLAGCVVPLAGFVAPIVIWQTKKAEIPEIDEHGRNAVNAIISYFIYAAIAGVVFLSGFVTIVGFVIGFLMWGVLAVLTIVLPIIAAIRANEGAVWRYPLALNIL